MVVGTYPFCSALEGFGQGRDQFRRERMTRVLDSQHARVPLRFGVDRDGAARWEVVDDGVLDEVRHHPQHERRGAEGTRCLACDIESDLAFFGERQQRFGGFFCDEGQVDGLAGEVSSVSAAE